MSVKLPGAVWLRTAPRERAPTSPLELAFFKALSANRADSTTRLVYADWLQDRGDRRADYLRVLCEWLGCQRAQEPELIERERNSGLGWAVGGWPGFGGYGSFVTTKLAPGNLVFCKSSRRRHDYR